MAAAGHPGFKAVQSKIAAKQGVSKESAGKILGAAAKKSVAKTGMKNAKPNMKRVVKAQGAAPKRPAKRAG